MYFEKLFRTFFAPSSSATDSRLLCTLSLIFANWDCTALQYNNQSAQAVFDYSVLPPPENSTQVVDVWHNTNITCKGSFHRASSHAIKWTREEQVTVSGLVHWVLCHSLSFLSHRG